MMHLYDRQREVETEKHNQEIFQEQEVYKEEKRYLCEESILYLQEAKSLLLNSKNKVKELCMDTNSVDIQIMIDAIDIQIDELLIKKEMF